MQQHRPVPSAPDPPERPVLAFEPLDAPPTLAVDHLRVSLRCTVSFASELLCTRLRAHRLWPLARRETELLGVWLGTRHLGCSGP